MATIPTATDVGGPTPRGATIGVQNAGGPALAAAEIGRTMQQASSRFQEIQNNDARYDAAKANADFLSAKAGIDAKYEQDPEYKTLGTRYKDDLTQLRSEYSQRLSNPLARNIFDIDAENHMTQGVARMGDVARAKEKDFERGYLTQALYNLKEAGVQGDVGASYGAAQLLVDAAKNKGYLGDEEGTKLMLNYRTDVALGRLQFLDPEARLGALNQKWAQFIPAEKRAEIKQAALEQSRTTRAQTQVESWLQKDKLDRPEIENRINAEKDPKMREKLRDQIDAQYSRRQKIVAEDQTNLLNQYIPMLQRGEITVDKIPVDVQNRLGKSWESLLSSQRNLVAYNTPYAPYSDPRVVQQVHELQAIGAHTELRQFVNENVHLLTESDYKTFGGIGLDGKVSSEAKGILSNQEYVLKRLGNAATNKEKSGNLLIAVDKWYSDYKEFYKKEPSPSEREKAVDQMLIDDAYNSYNNAGSVGSRITTQQIAAREPGLYRAILADYPGATNATTVVDIYRAIKSRQPLDQFKQYENK